MNKLLEYVAQGLQTLWINRLRSLLTALGIIIGVGSVIAILATGDSLTKSTQTILSGYSLAWSFVSARQQQPDPAKAAVRYDDARRVARLVKDADGVLPIIDVQMTADVNHHKVDAEVVSAGPGEGYDTTPLADGTRFTQNQVDAHQHVAIISDSLRNKLFPNESPLGRSIRLDGSYYRIVGVQTPPTTGGLLGSFAQYPDVTIPYTIAPDLGYTFVAFLAVHAPDAAQAAKIGNEAAAALRTIHGERTQYDEEDIQGDNQSIRNVFGVLTGVVGVIAAISLLVGGVGIMNIMLVSVTERTREIGIRKAIGAARTDIMLQFLIEAVLLCLAGGLIGLAIGVGLAELLIHTLISSLTGSTVAFDWLPVAEVAIGFSAGIGIVFGTYPAIRASFLNPIDCLRYE